MQIRSNSDPKDEKDMLSVSEQLLIFPSSEQDSGIFFNKTKLADVF